MLRTKNIQKFPRAKYLKINTTSHSVKHIPKSCCFGRCWRLWMRKFWPLLGAQRPHMARAVGTPAACVQLSLHQALTHSCFPTWAQNLKVIKLLKTGLFSKAAICGGSPTCADRGAVHQHRARSKHQKCCWGTRDIPALTMLPQPRKLIGNEQGAGKLSSLLLCIFSLFNQQCKVGTEECLDPKYSVDWICK